MLLLCFTQSRRRRGKQRSPLWIIRIDFLRDFCTGSYVDRKFRFVVLFGRLDSTMCVCRIGVNWNDRAWSGSFFLREEAVMSPIDTSSMVSSSLLSRWRHGVVITTAAYRYRLLVWIYDHGHTTVGISRNSWESLKLSFQQSFYTHLFFHFQSFTDFVKSIAKNVDWKFKKTTPPSLQLLGSLALNPKAKARTVPPGTPIAYLAS